MPHSTMVGQSQQARRGVYRRGFESRRSGGAPQVKEWYPDIPVCFSQMHGTSLNLSRAIGLFYLLVVLGALQALVLAPLLTMIYIISWFDQDRKKPKEIKRAAIRLTLPEMVLGCVILTAIAAVVLFTPLREILAPWAYVWLHSWPK